MTCRQGSAMNEADFAELRQRMVQEIVAKVIYTSAQLGKADRKSVV